MKIPKKLHPGSKIRIVSPAGKIDEKQVFPAVNWFEKKVYQVELGKHIFARHFQFAGTDEQRLEDLQTALDDPETDVIICSRGGYGTVRIIDRLDFTQFEKYPKWLVGFSDITILHSVLNNLGFATIHGAMPGSFFNKDGEASENLISLMNLLTGENITCETEKNSNNKAGQATGKLTGGNLSIIVSLLGTNYEIETAGKIMFLEDIDEYLYHIDRMMHQLKLAGKLENLAGLVIGSFTEIKDNGSPFGQSVEEIILNAVKEFDFPVSFGFPAGHDKKNQALIFGKKANLTVSSENAILNFEPGILN